MSSTGRKAAPSFKSGERLTVAACEDGQVWVKDDTGAVKRLPLQQYAERFEVYRAGSIQVAEGERLRITRNGSVRGRDGKEHRIDNGDMVTVRFTPEGDLIDQRGWIIPRDYGHWACGVVTSHSSQSLEDEVPFLAQSTASRGASNARQFYVSVSRGKQALAVTPTTRRPCARPCFVPTMPARRMRSGSARAAAAGGAASPAQVVVAAAATVSERRRRRGGAGGGEGAGSVAEIMHVRQESRSERHV